MTVIASIGERGELGRGGDLCWHIREDLRRFRELTMGSPVIMGRKTWESLPRRPLPGRLNIVVSRNPLFTGGADGADAPHVVARSLPEALKAAGGDGFIIGGASLYEQALPLADRLELTRILAADPEADTFFPAIDPARWRLTACSEVMTDATGLRFRYETYESSAALP